MLEIEFAEADVVVVGGGSDNAWQPPFQALLDSYASGDPARSRTRGLAKSEGLLLRSAFDHLERVSVLERRETPIERSSTGRCRSVRPGTVVPATAKRISPTRCAS